MSEEDLKQQLIMRFVTTANTSDAQLKDPKNYEDGIVPDGTPDQIRKTLLSSIQQAFDDSFEDIKYTVEIYESFLDNPGYIKYLDPDLIRDEKIKARLKKAMDDFGKRKHIDIRKKPLTSDEKYNALATIVGSSGSDIKRVRDAETFKGATRYAKNMNQKFHKGQEVYRADQRDIDGDGVNEIFVYKKKWDPVEKSYKFEQPYIVNGWKLARKNILRPLYQEKMQDTTGYGYDRMKYKFENDWPVFNEWKTTKLYDRQPDPKDPFTYIVKDGTEYTPEVYEKVLNPRVKPRTTRAPKSVFSNVVSQVIQKLYPDEKERKRFYVNVGGFMALASGLYSNFISSRVLDQLLQEYNIDPNDEKMIKKFKTKDPYKNAIKEEVRKFVNPDGTASNYAIETIRDILNDNNNE